jgi:tRNA uridine 5-carboxymethylaminomethyl modification enzyme
VEVEIKYEGYVARTNAVRQREAFDEWSIPPSVSFAAIRGLSAEAVEKLEQYRPTTVGHARRVPGLTPAAVSLLLIHLKRAHSEAL